MKVAFPVWNHRISPVFDTAQRLMVVTVEDGDEINRREWVLKENDFWDRVKQLQELGVEILLCGAISQSLENAIQTQGIQVISQVCGFADEILQAFLTDQIFHPQYQMPGCCGKRNHRCRHGREKWERKEHRRESGC